MGFQPKVNRRHPGPQVAERRQLFAARRQAIPISRARAMVF
ncbi:hypothetical protein RISK_004578 [Rhodopirellula islandica]|uniref:Uncharacterized protein n=1 Tax=Rhodopirellula islandica TaxID=595434 RepID=A0A0J1B9W6_RHOIS|nr:hypothetical protein RISK_004578 [Rhodopirellula islandica]